MSVSKQRRWKSIESQDVQVEVKTESEVKLQEMKKKFSPTRFKSNISQCTRDKFLIIFRKAGEMHPFLSLFQYKLFLKTYQHTLPNKSECKCVHFQSFRLFPAFSVVVGSCSQI